MTDAYTLRVEARQYTGANGAAIIDWIEELSGLYSTYFGWTLNGAPQESGGVITVATTPGMQSFTLTSGQWLVFTPFSLQQTDDAFFPIYNRPLLTQLVERVGEGELEGGGLTGQTQDIPVVLDAPMSSTAFVPDVSLLGPPSLLGGHGITGYTVDDEETVTVHVTSAIGAAAGATVRVVAREVV